MVTWVKRHYKLKENNDNNDVMKRKNKRSEDETPKSSDENIDAADKYKAGRYIILSAELFYISSLIPSSSLQFKFTFLLSIFLLKIFYFCYFMVRSI